MGYFVFKCNLTAQVFLLGKASPFSFCVYTYSPLGGDLVLRCPPSALPDSPVMDLIDRVKSWMSGRDDTLILSFSEVKTGKQLLKAFPPDPGLLRLKLEEERGFD